MRFGKVVGNVVATQKAESFVGVRLLVVQPLNERLQPNGDLYVAADPGIGAGEGDTVFVVFSRDATMAFDGRRIPVDASIVGLVDKAVVEEG